ncbi:hypothetical protein TRICI_000919 [Trichomonascus ciferrii]|uniref:Uncharacterized protein n=1 Tax=Trichomonascus ciferrii TaxID=44093 RepID=A0A642V9Y9_9ASCO|nr:hypothetical protein TRICI_000919 [Trichomonascus ciferrii]
MCYTRDTRLGVKILEVDTSSDRGSGRFFIDDGANLLLEGGRRAAVRADELDGEWSNDMGVDKSGTAELRKAKVEEENCLEDPVEWDPVEDGAGPKFHHREASIDNPVGEVLGVVISGSGLKGLQ